MNLTTRRYTEANIQTFTNDPNSFVFSVSSIDRFGDNGIVGVFILKIHGEECRIDTFLLSCRVIGRNIEQLMIAFIADFAKKQSAKALVGEYLPTAKNQPASDMYEKFKFKKISDTLFTANLKQQEFEYPSYIKHFIEDQTWYAYNYPHLFGGLTVRIWYCLHVMCQKSLSMPMRIAAICHVFLSVGDLISAHFMN